MIFQAFFDKIFGFMLPWPPILVILIVSFIVSLLIVIIYKWMTNQQEMKQLKDDLKEYQKKMKTLKDKPEELMKIQKESMSVNMRYMGKSMKPTLITFIPIILIFGWLNAHFAFEPLMPGEEFVIQANMHKGVTGNVSITAPEGLEIVGDSTKAISDRTVSFNLKGEEGEYYVTLDGGGEKQDKQILITTKRNYAPVIQSYKSDIFKQVTIGNEKLKVIWNLSWIWAYIIFAIIFSMMLRKLFKVY